MLNLLIEQYGQKMFNKETVEWCEKSIFDSRAKELMKPASVLLDIGCGIRPQRFVVPDFAILIEPHNEYVEILKRNFDSSNFLIVPLGALEALQALPNKSVDSIFMIDVIEHMPKSIGKLVLEQCERVARGQIVVFTPLGFMPQSVHSGEADGWGLNGGEFQDHKSGWYPEDFFDWQIVACANLHDKDHRGDVVSPAYGGFYAIRNIEKKHDIFNYLYSEKVIEEALRGFKENEIFENFIQTFIDREISRSNTKCAISASQVFAEKLSVGVPNAEISRVFEYVSDQRNNIFSLEILSFQQKVRDFAEKVLSTVSRESEVSAREAEVSARELEVSARDAKVEAREAVVDAKLARYNNLLLVRVARKIKRIFK